MIRTPQGSDRRARGETPEKQDSTQPSTLKGLDSDPARKADGFAPQRQNRRSAL
jgi:hypothetical protein